MRENLNLFKLIILILITCSFHSCDKKMNGKTPTSTEERTISNFEESFRTVGSESLKMKFISTNIVDITISDMIILNNERNFENFETKNINKEEIKIEDKTEKYINRGLKEIIAKRVNCKYILGDDYDQIIEKKYILNKTGNKVIYESNYHVVNGK